MKTKAAIPAPRERSSFDGDADLERVFKALADPTRRRVIERLGTRTVSTSELAADFDMALPSFLAHLRMLEDCGLVASHKAGRVRSYRLTPEPLDTAANWLDKRRQLWTQRLDQLDGYLAAQQRLPGEQRRRGSSVDLNKTPPPEQEC